MTTPNDDTTEVTNTAISLHELASIERIQRLEHFAQVLEQGDSNGERIANVNDLMMFQYLVQSLRADTEIRQQLALALQRIDELSIAREGDNAILREVIADNRETRRLTMASIDRIDILQRNVMAAMDRLGIASQEASAQALQIRDAEKKIVEHDRKLSPERYGHKVAGEIDT